MFQKIFLNEIQQIIPLINRYEKQCYINNEKT